MARSRAAVLRKTLLYTGLTVAAIVFVLACVGLVLTQGRHETTLVAKAITGLVSLYGILGSYGCVTFIGDMLSYARLLALGLTTAIIGMSINIMANLVRGTPWVGGVLFVLVLVLGHAFNFAVCILGAFVHSARLIFLEFFSRFYSADGVAFDMAGGHEFHDAVGEEDFVGGEEVFDDEFFLFAGDVIFLSEFDNHLAGDAGQDGGVGRRCEKLIVFDKKNIADASFG